MKRWGAALACGLILATTFSGVAQAEPSDPAPPPPATPAPCAPLREGQFGALAADQIGTATVAPGQNGCHEITLTAGPHYLQAPSSRSFPPSVLVRDAVGPYVVSTIGPPQGTSDEIQIRSLTSAAGCPTVTVGGADELSGIRCRSLTVPAAGTYAVTALGTDGDSRALTVRDADGNVVCESAGPCTFTAVGTYILIADGHTSVIRDAPYAVTLAPAIS